MTHKKLIITLQNQYTLLLLCQCINYITNYSHLKYQCITITLMYLVLVLCYSSIILLLYYYNYYLKYHILQLYYISPNLTVYLTLAWRLIFSKVKTK